MCLRTATAGITTKNMVVLAMLNSLCSTATDKESKDAVLLTASFIENAYRKRRHGTTETYNVTMDTLVNCCER